MTDLRLFLVVAKVRANFYMSDENDMCDDMRIVWATDSTEATQKYEKHWEDMSAPYDTSYTIMEMTITPALM